MLQSTVVFEEYEVTSPRNVDDVHRYQLRSVRFCCQEVSGGNLVHCSPEEAATGHWLSTICNHVQRLPSNTYTDMKIVCLQT
jgi:hypothetical protein